MQGLRVRIYVLSDQPPMRPNGTVPRPVVTRICFNDACSTQINNRPRGEPGEEP